MLRSDRSTEAAPACQPSSSLRAAAPLPPHAPCAALAISVVPTLSSRGRGVRDSPRPLLKLPSLPLGRISRGTNSTSTFRLRRLRETQGRCASRRGGRRTPPGVRHRSSSRMRRAGSLVAALPPPNSLPRHPSHRHLRPSGRFWLTSETPGGATRHGGGGGFHLGPPSQDPPRGLGWG